MAYDYRVLGEGQRSVYFLLVFHEITSSSGRKIKETTLGSAV